MVRQRTANPLSPGSNPGAASILLRTKFARKTRGIRASEDARRSHVPCSVPLWYRSGCARVAELADARDLKSRGLYGPWGFDSPPGHHGIQDTNGLPVEDPHRARHPFSSPASVGDRSILHRHGAGRSFRVRREGGRGLPCPLQQHAQRRRDGSGRNDHALSRGGVFESSNRLHRDAWTKSSEGFHEIRGKRLGIIGCAIIDVDDPCETDILSELEAIPNTIRARLVY